MSKGPFVVRLGPVINITTKRASRCGYLRHSLPRARVTRNRNALHRLQKSKTGSRDRLRALFAPACPRPPTRSQIRG